MRNQQKKKGKYCKELICILIDREKRIRKKYIPCVYEREKERKKDRKTERQKER
jgi:hypothetical protein